eukprot:CAMPEP_0174834658 /NCGR_PEP_ID=MMETSP1114-20130205/4961_1 /TAXON_ID=312471 /ORGANISM="Neobodo designis, Strain CCAP 1951/1" /LENGTH=252 /DNA_ID=CAMNT_0016068581 /DNA_START=28 /DNA_END=783 /DNA_ORIENTATION=-
MARCGFTRAELEARLREARYGVDEAMFRCYFMRGPPDDASGAPLCAVCHHSIPSHPAGEVAVKVPSSESTGERAVMATVVKSAPRDGGSEHSATTPEFNRAQKLQCPAALRRRGDFDVIDNDESCSWGFNMLACVFFAGLCMLVAGIIGFVVDGVDTPWIMLTIFGGTGSLTAGVLLSTFTGQIVEFDVPRSAKPAAQRTVTVTSWRSCCLPCMGRSEQSCRCCEIEKVVASGEDSEEAANVALHLPKSCGG